jgi:hypothetical protein
MIPGWFDEIEREVVSCLGGGSLHPHGLAGRLGVSERCAVGYITMLALAGRLVIELVAPPPGGGKEEPPSSTVGSPRPSAEPTPRPVPEEGPLDHGA